MFGLTFCNRKTDARNLIFENAANLLLSAVNFVKSLWIKVSLVESFAFLLYIKNFRVEQ